VAVLQPYAWGKLKGKHIFVFLTYLLRIMQMKANTAMVTARQVEEEFDHIMPRVWN
jgi:hypothetical protein